MKRDLCWSPGNKGQATAVLWRGTSGFLEATIGVLRASWLSSIVNLSWECLCSSHRRVQWGLLQNNTFFIYPNYLLFLSNKIDVKSYKNSTQSTLVSAIFLAYKSFLHIHFITYPYTSLLLELQGSFIILSYIRTLLNIKSNKGKITYKGTSIRLSTDFLTETLQARREWHDIFKVMKGRNIQLRTQNLPRKILLHIWWRNQKLCRQANIKRIQHHQTSFTTNAKGTSLGRKQEKEKTNLQKTNSKQ